MNSYTTTNRPWLAQGRIHPARYKGLAFCFLLAAYLFGAATAPAQGSGGIHQLGAGVRSSPTSMVKALLREPRHLRLVGSRKAKNTFFFRATVSVPAEHRSFGMVAVCRVGASAVLVYGANGLPYAYYGNGLLVLVDLKEPGRLDVYRGVSPGLVISGGPPTGHHLLTTTFLLAPLDGPAGMIDLNIFPWLRSAAARATRVRLEGPGRTLVFTGKRAVFRVTLNPPGSHFPINAATASAPAKGTLSIWDISPGKEPLRKFFGITLTTLKSCGVPLRVRRYRVRPIDWFPPPNFGSKPGEIHAAEALGRLLPIDAARERTLKSRWMIKRIAVLRKKGATGEGPGARLIALTSLFRAVEWGGAGSVDSAAIHTEPDGPHQGLNWRWNFNRARYHEELERAWGKKAVQRLIRELARVATSKRYGPAYKFIALDMMSDIGLGQGDADWDRADGFLAKALATAKNPAALNAFQLAVFRARLDLPISAGLLAGTTEIFNANGVPAAVRLRALEVLCFIGKLPDDPKVIVPLVKTSLTKSAACLASPAAGRYLFDLSLCRTGRKILLHELLDRHSQLANEPLLPAAAFNRLWPGWPGYNLAIRAALHVFSNRAYSAALRRQALAGLMRAPRKVFRRAMGHLLKPRAQFLDTTLRIIAAEKDAAYFMPQFRAIFPQLTNKQKVMEVGWAVELGFAKGASAAEAAPLIHSALRDHAPSVALAGLRCIGEFRYLGVPFDAAVLYHDVLQLVISCGQSRLNEGAEALYCFSLATRGQWVLPSVSMYQSGGADCTSRSGRAWWQQHYAAERASALKWAAEHPNDPSAIPK